MSSRSLVLVGALLAAEGIASADKAIEVAAGLALPVAGEAWNRDADAGWKVAGRGMADVGDQRGVIGVEFARIPNRYCGVSFSRYRVTAGLAHGWTFEHTSLSTRVAVGVDAVTCTSRSRGLVPTGLPMERQYFDLGLGGEAAATLWLVEGTVDVGIEVGSTFSLHWFDGDSESAVFDYLGVDLDVLLAIRVR